MPGSLFLHQSANYENYRCSFSTRFTVNKDANGSLPLLFHAGDLAKYDDFIVQPSVSPTDIICGS
jgi:hypothetical protein